jgi:hypothetical protein
MSEYRFHLSISAAEYLAYYQGTANKVVARLTNGQALQFPADALRPFVTHEGVWGEFVLSVNDQNKLQGLRRVEE